MSPVVYTSNYRNASVLLLCHLRTCCTHQRKAIRKRLGITAAVRQLQESSVEYFNGIVPFLMLLSGSLWNILPIGGR